MLFNEYLKWQRQEDQFERIGEIKDNERKIKKEISLTFVSMINS